MNPFIDLPDEIAASITFQSKSALVLRCVDKWFANKLTQTRPLQMTRIQHLLNTASTNSNPDFLQFIANVFRQAQTYEQVDTLNHDFSPLGIFGHIFNTAPAGTMGGTSLDSIEWFCANTPLGLVKSSQFCKYLFYCPKCSICTGYDKYDPSHYNSLLPSIKRLHLTGFPLNDEILELAVCIGDTPTIEFITAELPLTDKHICIIINRGHCHLFHLVENNAIDADELLFQAYTSGSREMVEHMLRFIGRDLDHSIEHATMARPTAEFAQFEFMLSLKTGDFTQDSPIYRILVDYQRIDLLKELYQLRSSDPRFADLPQLSQNILADLFTTRVNLYDLNWFYNLFPFTQDLLTRCLNMLGVQIIPVIMEGIHEYVDAIEGKTLEEKTELTLQLAKSNAEIIQNTADENFPIIGQALWLISKSDPSWLNDDRIQFQLDKLAHACDSVEIFAYVTNFTRKMDKIYPHLWKRIYDHRTKNITYQK